MYGQGGGNSAIVLALKVKCSFNPHRWTAVRSQKQRQTQQ
jgi:hypothetical protein